MSAQAPAIGVGVGLRSEISKIAAFFRRNLLISWSYRMAFFSNWISLGIQLVLFAMVSRVVDPAKLPEFGGRPASYIEFVVIGVTVTSLLQLALTRVLSSIRNEQMMGTIESLLLTPTSYTTIQLGFVAYDLIYVPIRTAILLFAATVLFGVHLNLGGAGPAIVVMLALMPFAWGLGMLGAAGAVTFRRGAGVTSIGALLLTVGSSTYLPVEALPRWGQTIVELNPLTHALEAVRDALLGSAGLASSLDSIVYLVPWGIGSLLVGMTSFHLAVRRERRRGTLSLY